MSRTTIRLFEFERIRVGEERVSTRGHRAVFSEAHFEAIVRFSESTPDRILEVGHRSLKFTNFVGYLQVGGLGIEILPKADRAVPRDDGRAVWHDALLEMLAVAGHLQIKSPSVAQLDLRRADLMEIFVACYLDEVLLLLHQGLAKGYREERGNRPAFQGRLLVQDDIRKNLVHRERFFVEYQVYDFDTLPNRILRAALVALQGVPLSVQLQRKVRTIAAVFPDMPAMRVSQRDFARLRLSRNTLRYRKALDLARLILMGQSPRLAAGSTNLLAILFDMNALWEAYIGTLLRRVAPEGLKVSLQSSKVFWREPGQRGRTIRPDALIRNSQTGEVSLVLDTKWKCPPRGRPADADLKQMFAYNELFESERSLLLYPASDATISPALGLYGGRSHGCQTAFVDPMDSDGRFSTRQVKEQLAALVA